MNPWYQKRGTWGQQDHTLEAGMYIISKTFGPFCASHRLRGLPTDHQCARLHGHNYSVTLELSSWTLDDVGFVVDYGNLKPFEDSLKEFADHRHLNEVSPFDNVNPTAENLAYYFYTTTQRFWWHNRVSGVGVSETDKTWAWFRKEVR